MEKAVKANLPVTPARSAAIAGGGKTMPAVPVLHTPVQRIPSATPVIQLMTPEELAALIAFVKAGDKKGFKAKFRAIHPAQDEWISCELTYDRAVALNNTGDDAGMRQLLNTSSDLRFPTSHMAHNIGASQVIHPTAPSTVPYGAPLNANGNPRWLQHTTENQNRLAFVNQGAAAPQMQDRAVEYSTRRWAQPPFASNSNVALDVNDPQHRAAHEKREQNKTLHSSHSAAAAPQPYNAPWVPRMVDQMDGTLSPFRMLPPIAAPQMPQPMDLGPQQAQPPAQQPQPLAPFQPQPLPPAQQAQPFLMPFMQPQPPQQGPQQQFN